MGQRELEALGDELLDVWSLDVFRVGEFDDFEDLLESRLLVEIAPPHPYTSPLFMKRGDNVRECS